MIIQINSGNGPKECQRACYLYYRELIKEYPDLEVIDENRGDKDCLFSISLYSEKDLSHLNGTVQWICESPFRANHKRKNWYINITILQEDKLNDELGEIKYESFRSSGKGGQNVNKVSTAVRATHLPTKLSVVCMDQRKQLQNKKLAKIRLIDKLTKINQNQLEGIKYQNWNQHNQIVRGNPHSVYKGTSFKKIK